MPAQKASQNASRSASAARTLGVGTVTLHDGLAVPFPLQLWVAQHKLL